jgi:hypothetical protein
MRLTFDLVEPTVRTLCVVFLWWYYSVLVRLCECRIFVIWVSVRIMPVRTDSPVVNSSTICNGAQSLVGAPGSHHPRMGPLPMCPMVPHLHNDPFYCSPFGNPYYRWDDGAPTCVVALRYRQLLLSCYTKGAFLRLGCRTRSFMFDKLKHISIMVCFLITSFRLYKYRAKYFDAIKYAIIYKQIVPNQFFMWRRKTSCFLNHSDI